VGLLALLLALSGCGPKTIPPVTDLSIVDWSKSVYVVKLGDGLESVSFSTGKRVEDLARWNKLSKPYTIYVGEEIGLNPGTGKRLSAKKVKEVKKSPQQPKTSHVKTRPEKPKTAKLASQPIQEAKLPDQVAGWRWPAKGKLIQTFSKSKGRYGIQIAAQRGSPVLATAAGQVVYVGDGIKGYGQLVIVKHSEKYLSAYAHNDRILVKEGERVKAGQTLAKMGSTGSKTVKLHFEVRKNGEPVNPLSYLPKKQG